MRDTLPKADPSLREGGNARGVWFKTGYGRGAERGGLRAGSDSGGGSREGSGAGKRCESREGERLCGGECSGDKVPAAGNERRVAVRPPPST